ncbi:hypothetical protein AAC387_Pa10g1995 [Persea americana]
MEITPTKVELLQATKVEEAGVYSTFNPTTVPKIPVASEIESNHVTHGLITSDAFPSATISVRIPRIQPRRRIIETMIYRKPTLELKEGQFLVMKAHGRGTIVVVDSKGSLKEQMQLQ